MSRTETKYKVELLCDYPEWWRYNVFMMIVGFDDDGNNAAFNNLVDRVYDVSHDGEPRKIPSDYPARRVISLITDACSYIDVYIYVVANTFPLSEVIGASPSFEAVLRVSADGGVLRETACEINQWGGLTIAGERVEVSKP